MRVLRERDGRPEKENAADSVAAAFVMLATEVGDDTALKRLQALRFHPVFTAHPTEARRSAVSRSIRRLANLLDEYDIALRNGADERRTERRMIEEIDTLWRTAPLRAEKPSPTDEVRSIMEVFDETLYTAIPHVYRRLDDALQGPGAGSRAPIVRPFVRVGSWVGGDRDGNPFVTASDDPQGRGDCERAHPARPRALREPHRPDAHAGCDDHSPESGAPRAARDARAPTTRPRPPRSPSARPTSRTVVSCCSSRARSPRRAREATPRSPIARAEDLLADLRTVQDSLAQARAPRQAYGHLQQLIWQVETFGFHLTELEVRQHSAVHAKALADLEAGGPRSEQTARGARGVPQHRRDPAQARPARGRPVHRVVHAFRR